MLRSNSQMSNVRHPYAKDSITCLVRVSMYEGVTVQYFSTLLGERLDE